MYHKYSRIIIPSITEWPLPTAEGSKSPTKPISTNKKISFTSIDTAFIFSLNSLYISVKPLINSKAIMPAPTPETIAIQHKFTGTDGKAVSENMAVVLPKIMERASAVSEAKTTDESATISIMGEKRLCTSSKAKMIPVAGAPVATAKPAAAPPVITYLSQAGVRLKRLFVPRPSAVPIRTDGPSFPSGNPVKNAM